MSRRPCRFTQAELVLALEEAAKLGPRPFVEVAPDGTIRAGQLPEPEPKQPASFSDRSGFYCDADTSSHIGHVYFIQAEESQRIKIGFSENPIQRLASLSTSSSESLALLASFPATMADERELHKKFAHLRIRGEWFSTSPEIMAYIEGAPK